MDETGTELSMSTTSTKDNKYNYARIMDKSSMMPRGSAERNKNNRKTSNDWLKDELSSLIAEFSYLTDVSAKTSKEKNRMPVSPSYHVYAADTIPGDKGPFRVSSRSGYPDDRKENLVSSKTVEWKDDVKRKQFSHRHSPKTYNQNGNRRNREDDFGPSRQDKNVRKSRSKRTKSRLNNERSHVSLRSRSRSKYKSPKRSSHNKLNRSKRSKPRFENKSDVNKFRISSSDRAVKRPRKSRSRRVNRQEKSRSKSNVRLVKKRSMIKKLRVSSYDRLENGGIRHKKVRSKSQVDVVEKRYVPIGYKKRSKSLYKGFYPFRYEGRKKKKVIIKRRKSIPLLRKYEVIDSIPSEAATVLTIYPRLDPKRVETKLEPDFLTDQTLPCKCFQCMRKYKSIVDVPKAQSHFRKKQPKLHSCMCDGYRQTMEGHQNMPYCTVKPINTKKLPRDPWRNMTCDFGKCAMPALRIPQHEIIKRYYQEIPYSHHDNIAEGDFCHAPLSCFSSEPESGYVTGQSVKNVYFKLNCYTHHIDSEITQYFHSILGHNNVY